MNKKILKESLIAAGFKVFTNEHTKADRDFYYKGDNIININWLWCILSCMQDITKEVQLSKQKR